MLCEDEKHSMNGSIILDPLRASGRLMVVTLRRSCSIKGSTRITTLYKECYHIPRFNQEVIVVGAKSTQAEELSVRDSTLVVVRMKRREMEVVSVCFLVKDRGVIMDVN